MAEELETETAPAPALAPVAPQSEPARVLASIKASTFKPVYEPLDLGEISPEFGGQSLQILRNPSSLFRRTFGNIAADPDDEDFVEWVGYIFDMTPAQAREWLDLVDQSLYVFFFVPLYVAETETRAAHWQKRAVGDIWDTYAIERAKKYHAR